MLCWSLHTGFLDLLMTLTTFAHGSHGYVAQEHFDMLTEGTGHLIE